MRDSDKRLIVDPKLMSTSQSGHIKEVIAEKEVGDEESEKSMLSLEAPAQKRPKPKNLRINPPGISGSLSLTSKN